MGIKWTKYTYRIACRRKSMDGIAFTGEQLVNGYVCPFTPQLILVEPVDTEKEV